MASDDARLEIDLDELVAMGRAVVEATKAQGIARVCLESDFYWAIAPEERTNVYDEPASFTIGQVSEDLASLRRVVQAGGYVPPNALIWLGRCLEALGEELTP